jgi:uncharacterized DUF497 family protein
MYNRAYNGVVDMLQYEWDAHKAQTNYEKHKIAFADAVSAFGDDYAITIVDDHPEESRYILLGQDSQNRILVVVYAYRDERIRIISARKATQTEINQYLKE